jgi:hypothetical protein
MAIRTVAMDPTSKDLVARSLKRVDFINVQNDTDYKIAFDPTTVHRVEHVAFSQVLRATFNRGR